MKNKEKKTGFVLFCRLSDAGDRGGAATGGEQRSGHRDCIKSVASGARRRPGASPPPVAF